MMFHKADHIEIDVYILCLHKFEDDRVILDGDELENASRAIKECLKKQDYLGKEEVDEELRQKEKWYVYTLCPINLLEKELPDDIRRRLQDEVYCNITEAKLGYYHHRTIVKFKLEYPQYDFSSLREIRQELKRKADEIIHKCVKEKVNDLFFSGKMKEEGIIRFLYTYPFIVVKNGVKECKTVPFSQETGTLSFDIYELGRLKLTSKRSMMRVSGPSIVLFTKGDVDPKLLRDIINAIYQHCLYEKKLRDEEKGTFENTLDESIIVRFWRHIIDTMGGEYIDVFISRINIAMYILAIAAAIFSGVTLIRAILGGG